MTAPRTLLDAWGLRPQKQLGQNFLTDPSTAAMIVTRAAVGPQDVVLEIGGGLGALTIPLARQVRKVITVEKDRRLVGLLRTELVAAGVANVAVLAADIRRVDIHALAREAGRRLVVAGNLPYNISSQILVQLVERRTEVERAVLMFQKELAQRILAAPGGRDYGRLTVLLQYSADVRTLAELKAASFYPRPKIDSTVLEVRFKARPQFPAADEDLLFRVVKAAFGQRRKTLKNALAGGSLTLDGAGAERALTAAGIDPGRRAETLAVADFVALANHLSKVLGH